MRFLASTMIFLLLCAVSSVAQSGDAKKVQPKKDQDELQGVPRETSHWLGYQSQPHGPTKWWCVQFELTTDEKGQVSGKSLTWPFGRRENILMKIKGDCHGNKLGFKEVEVLQKSPPLPGTRWITDSSFVGTVGPYGALLGTWSNPKHKAAVADSEMLLVRMDYHIVIQRQEKQDDAWTRSTLSLNGTALGDVYENTKKLIPAGVYPGRRHYGSPKSIVQSAGRQLGTKGDFLLEIVNVPKRKNVFIFPGDKTGKVDDGVIAGAPVKKGDAWLAPPVLAALRWHFYGTDNTIPLDPLYLQKELNIKIELRDAVPGASPLPTMIGDESSLAQPLTRPIKLLNPIQAPKK